MASIRTITGDERQRALAEANGLQPEALAANRSGRITSHQARILGGRRSGRSWALVVIAILCIWLGAWELLRPTDPEDGRTGPVTVLLVGAACIAARFTGFGRSLAPELAAGKVDSVEGFVRWRHSSSIGDSGSCDMYWYCLAGREFQTTEEGAKLIDPKLRYRIYHLPGTDVMVNIEAIG